MTGSAICGETSEPRISLRSPGLRWLPLAQRVGSSIAQWLSPQFGEAIRVTIDTDRIDALAADRAALWDRVSGAPFLTLNEKREAVGYGRIAGGDRWG
jgi:phage portal protein BeeE